MADFTFVTSNPHKVKTAKTVCAQFGLSFEHQHMDLQEIQASNGKAIAEYKVAQAYQKYQGAVAVTDDSWAIPGLKGFPGAYMRYVNDWFTPQDFFNLTKNLEDRRIIMSHVIAFKNANLTKTFSVDIPGVLLKQVRGQSPITHFSIMSFDGGHNSVAEAEANDSSAVAQLPNAWHDFCEWFSKLDA